MAKSWTYIQMYPKLNFMAKTSHNLLLISEQSITHCGQYRIKWLVTEAIVSQVFPLLWSFKQSAPAEIWTCVLKNYNDTPTQPDLELWWQAKLHSNESLH